MIISNKHYLSASAFNKLFVLSVILLTFVLSFTACTKNVQQPAPTQQSNSTTQSSTTVQPGTTTQSTTVAPKNTNLILATTTSVNDSGLMDYLRPIFEKDTGMKLKVISQGTGQAIKTGQDGNADVLLIHDKASEEKFISEGHGLKRIELAYNYFVIVGPKDDPAGISKQKVTASQAFSKIAAAKSTFISRGDDSGTNKKELKIWAADKIKPSGSWYISAGKGMGDVLSMASEKKGYTLTDKATYLSMKDKLDLNIVVDASKDLLNQYTLIEVNPTKHPDINKEGADIFVNWMTSDNVLKMINDYGKDKYGESLFIVNYKK